MESKGAADFSDAAKAEADSCVRDRDLKPWRKISLFVLSLCTGEDGEQGKESPRKKWEERKLDCEEQDRK